MLSSHLRSGPVRLRKVVSVNLVGTATSARQEWRIVLSCGHVMTTVTRHRLVPKRKRCYQCYQEAQQLNESTHANRDA